MGLVDIDNLVAVWGGVLPVELVEEGIAFSVLADSPVGRGCFVHTRGVMGSWPRRTSIALVKPGFCMRKKLLLVVVPKNLGPTE